MRCLGNVLVVDPQNTETTFNQADSLLGRIGIVETDSLPLRMSFHRARPDVRCAIIVVGRHLTIGYAVPRNIPIIDPHDAES